MSTNYRYTIRNVAQREIYDSYMGILRISPNLDKNGKMVDDPTNFLNTLGCQDIQLSSSNGDALPVHFVPYAFTTKNVYFNENGNIIRKTKDIINICTDTTLSNVATGNTFVSNDFIVRSSLHLLSNTDKKKSKIAISYGCHNTDDNHKADCEGILLYPIESPNDSTYFNNKNALNLFDKNNPKSRTEQVEEALLKKSVHWYNTEINNDICYTDDSKINTSGANKKIQSHRVKVNNQYINQYNSNNEEVPILYTRDYVLGHYEGHSQRTNDSNRNTLKTHYLPSDSQIYNSNESDNVTKLSWIRFDNLIWDCLDEVLAGKTRHTNGRYTDLGTYIDKKGNSIVDKLFGQEEIENIKQYSNLYQNENPKQFLDYTAPLVGKGVQEGMIMYHSMPFHRYWFHRCRQVLFNMEEFKRQYQLSYGDSTESWADMITDEKHELQEFYNNKLITPCCKASITPHHSLVKNFLLCNGQEVNLTNFPNISFNNNNLLKDAEGEDLIKGKQATPNKNACFIEKNDWETSSTYYALRESSTGSTNCIKLPNLFNFQEKYPRFIRGLNWLADTENIQDFSITNEIINVDSSLTENNNRMAYIQNDEINTKKNVWEEYGKCIVKNFKSVDKPYYFSFDYLTQKNNHRHLLFAKTKGLTKSPDSYTTLVTFGYKTSVGTGKIPYNVSYIPILHNGYNLQNLPNNDDIQQSWKNWYNYNFNNTTFYNNFQPIHTAGLYYFNKDFSYMAKTNSNNSNGSDWIIDDSWHYYDANGTKHLMNTAPISDFIDEQSSIDYPSLNQYRHERNKRKQLIIKLNESEGISPISIYGGPPNFSTSQRQTWQRKRTSILKKRWDWEEGVLVKQNVATYNLYGAEFDYKDSPYNIDDGTYHWRSLTSLQYWNCEKLAVGDIPAIENEKYLKRELIPSTATDYYNYHNVTDVWRKSNSQKNEEITYGSSKVKVDTSSPYPSFLNLLPLIRL